MTSQSPGNAAPAPTATSAPAPEMAATATPSKPKQHWASHSMMLPEDASARTYLHIASMAIRHHDRGVADDALSHAETRLLDRAVPQGDIAADDSPSVQSIESARKALQAGDYHAASMDTRQAATAVSGM